MEVSYESYAHWRAEMIEKARLTLDADYCEERIAALANAHDRSTKAFLKAYGVEHRDRVIKWFEQGRAES